MYMACLMLGALSPDHHNVRMTPRDFKRYYGRTHKHLMGIIGGTT